jgi:2-oxoglutarate ferredoxin oxidoreductase subunit beta
VKLVEMHDGTTLALHKLAKDWNYGDKLSIVTALHKARAKNEILTGLLYLDPESVELNDLINTINTPLNSLTEKELCPGDELLQMVNAGLR